MLDCHASDGWLVWRQSRRPDDGPHELWAQHGGGQPVLIHRGAMPETYPYTSGGSLLWMKNDEQMVLESLAHPGKPFLFPRYFIRFDPFGDERFLGFVSETTDGYTDTAHLVDVWAPRLDAG